MAIELDAIFEDMKRKIVNLDYLPGQKITEEYLSETYNISRTPVRGIIARLEKEGLLEVRPKRGTFISKINYKNVSDLMTIRKMVETSILERLCGNLTEDQIKELNKILDEQKNILIMEPSIEKSKKFFHNDNLFHKTLFVFAGYEGVWTIIHTNATNLNRVRIMANLRESTQVEKIYVHHLKMVDYLIDGNKEELLKIFNEHIDGGFEGVEEIMEKYNNYFI